MACTRDSLLGVSMRSTTPTPPKLISGALASSITSCSGDSNSAPIGSESTWQSVTSVATLVTLCQVLSLPIGALFESPLHEVIELAKAPLINFGGVGVVERMLTPRSESRVQAIRSRLDPFANGGDDYYTISCDVEVVHVLEGAITMRFPNGEVDLHTGDSMTVPGREPHTWVNRSNEPAEVIWTIVPASWSGSSRSRSRG